MLRGLLRNRSKDIDILQKFLDPFVLANISFLLFNRNGLTINLNFLILYFLYFIILNFNKLYESYRFKNINSIIPRIIFICSSLTIINLFFNIYDSKLENSVLINFFLLASSYLISHHYILRAFLRFIRKRGYNSRNIVFFGNKNSFKNLVSKLEKTPWLGYRIQYWFSPNADDKKIKLNLISGSYKCEGGIKELINAINKENLDKLFFSHDDSDDINLKEKINFIGDTCISASFLIDWNIPSLSLREESFGDCYAFNLWNPGYSIFNEKIKRFFDFNLGLIIIIALIPIYLIIAILIKVSSKGPILFIQNRYGLNGKIFKMYKFRTMFLDQRDTNKKIIQATKNDKRITKVGRILRKYSLDELPQLINVIKGEMSLVGPRPHASEHNEYYRKMIPGYMQRHSKLPGMTGLAQVMGARGETNDIEKMKLRIEYDIAYNNNWNLIEDFLILFKTFFSIFKGNGY